LKIPGIHPHELRLTAATLAIASDADVKVVQQMLGHKSGTMTLALYGHLFGDRLDVVADAMDSARASALSVCTHCAPRDVMPMPDHLSFEEGAAFCVSYGTAYAALMIMGGLRERDRVLIHSAAGGVGIAATQVARNVGAEIFGTASAAKHTAISAQGVHHPIDYRSQDFKAEVRKLTDGQGVDVVMDAMGPASFRKDYRILRPGGRLIIYGLSDAVNEDGRNLRSAVSSLLRLPTSTMPWWNAGRLLNQNRGVFTLHLLSWWRREGDMHRITAPLLTDLEAGKLAPVVAKVFPFSRAGDAHRFLAERRNIGKVVLTPG
jgi:NADPH:quinone reductase-like Zn-dependent oxidoreductase